MFIWQSSFKDFIDRIQKKWWAAVDSQMCAVCSMYLGIFVMILLDSLVLSGYYKDVS